MVQAQKASNSNEDEAPAWAPLRDNYMLANPKLKDWDKKQVPFILIHSSETTLLAYTLSLRLVILLSTGNKRGR